MVFINSGQRSVSTVMSLTPSQSRAARGLLAWSQIELATRAGLGESTIRDFEKGRRVPTAKYLGTVQRTLEAAGVIFIDGNEEGPGVRLRRSESSRVPRDTQEAFAPRAR